MTDSNWWPERHEATQHFEPMFQFDHLSPGPHRDISEKCADFAWDMVRSLPDGPELTVGLRKLWEAKNSFVIQAARFSGVQVPPNRG